MNKAKQSEIRSTMRNAILSKSQFQKEATHGAERDGALILEKSIIILRKPRPFIYDDVDNSKVFINYSQSSKMYGFQ